MGGRGLSPSPVGASVCSAENGIGDLRDPQSLFQGWQGHIGLVLERGFGLGPFWSSAGVLGTSPGYSCFLSWNGADTPWTLSAEP